MFGFVERSTHLPLSGFECSWVAASELLTQEPRLLNIGQAGQEFCRSGVMSSVGLHEIYAGTQCC